MVGIRKCHGLGGARLASTETLEAEHCTPPIQPRPVVYTLLKHPPAPIFCDHPRAFTITDQTSPRRSLSLSPFALRHSSSTTTTYTSAPLHRHITITSRDQGYLAVSSNLPGDPYRPRSNLATASSTRRAPLSRVTLALSRIPPTTRSQWHNSSRTASL
jgi:hypothetical protein